MSHTEARIQELLGKIAELENQVTFYKLVADHTFDGEILFDPSGRMVYVNNGFENITGYHKDEILNGAITDKDIVFQEDRRKVIAGFKKLLKQKPVYDLEFRILRKDSQIRYLSLYAIPVFQNNQFWGVRASARDITDQNRFKNYDQTLQSLQLSDKKFKDFIEISPNAILLTNAEGRFIYVNHAACQLLKFNKQELEKSSINDILPSSEIESGWKHFEEVKKKGAAYNLEIQLKRKDGQLMDVILDGKKISDEEYIAFIKNISKRKKIETIIRQNKDRLQILYDLSLLTEVDTDQLYNIALEKLQLLTSSQIGFLGFLNTEETHVRIHAWSASTMRSCEIKEKPINFEVAKAGLWGEVVRQRSTLILNDFKNEHPMKRGMPAEHVEVLNFMSVPIFDKGKIVAIVAVGNKAGDYDETDIQEVTLLMEGVWNIVKQRNYEAQIINARKFAEENAQKLRDTENRYRKLFENMSSGVAIYQPVNEGADFIFLDFNKAAERITNISKAAVTGKSLRAVFPNMIDKPLFRALQTVCKTGEDFYLPPFYYKDTYREGWRENHLYQLSGGEIVAIFEDVTERKNAEIQLRNQNDDLKVARDKAEESNQLKTAFLQNISHEIRTPLNAICGFSGMLTQPDLSDEKRESFISIIQTSSNQLLSIVSDILTISSLETGQEKVFIEKVCVNSLIVDLLAVFKPQSHHRNISLYARKTLSDNESLIYTDKTKLTQILTNLLTNALKFTHEGSVEFGYQLKNNQLEFYVKDTGIGIEPEFQTRIFERFRQADLSISNKYGGTGLGLSISKGFTELLGGAIRVDSQKNNGSTFYVTFPYKPAGDQDKTKVMELAGTRNFNPAILVAEDEELNFLFIEELLSGLGLRLIHAKNGQEAVRVFHSNREIALVIMDIKMPLMDGYTAAKIIKKHRPDLPIIAQSAYALEHEVQKYSHVFEDYLTKPFTGEALKDTVLRFIGKQI